MRQRCRCALSSNTTATSSGTTSSTRGVWCRSTYDGEGRTPSPANGRDDSRVADGTIPMIELEVDGKAVEVPEGSTVMDAANRLRIYVPHFCYHKKLSIAA